MRLSSVPTLQPSPLPALQPSPLPTPQPSPTPTPWHAARRSISPHPSPLTLARPSGVTLPPGSRSRSQPQRVSCLSVWSLDQHSTILSLLRLKPAGNRRSSKWSMDQNVPSPSFRRLSLWSGSFLLRRSSRLSRARPRRPRSRVTKHTPTFRQRIVYTQMDATPNDFDQVWPRTPDHGRVRRRAQRYSSSCSRNHPTRPTKHTNHVQM